MNFVPFPKIARWSRDVVVTEKLDGTNAQVCIVETAALDPAEFDPRLAIVVGGEFTMLAGSRNRWITPADDNYGFAAWAQANASELFELGEGSHYGEWWGQGVGRHYGLDHKRFSLFNVGRWRDNAHVVFESTDGQKTPAPPCCSVVPTLYRGPNDEQLILEALKVLAANGSAAAPGFMNPEGVVIYHTASQSLFKKTIVADERPKGQA